MIIKIKVALSYDSYGVRLKKSQSGTISKITLEANFCSQSRRQIALNNLIKNTFSINLHNKSIDFYDSTTSHFAFLEEPHWSTFIFGVRNRLSRLGSVVKKLIDTSHSSQIRVMRRVVHTISQMAIQSIFFVCHTHIHYTTPHSTQSRNPACGILQKSSRA